MSTPVSIAGASSVHLERSAKLWFIVAVGGQLMLAVYVAWFYGSTAVQGRVDAWTRVLTRGYVAGDTAGNAAIIGHLAGAVMLIVSGAILLIPQVRDRVPALHRWTGRLYLLFAFAGSLTGLYMTWIRGTRGDLSQFIGGSLNAVLIMLCAAFALRSAIARRFAVHRRWVLRLFLMVSAAWFYRVGLFLWLLIHQAPAGFDPETFRGPTLTFLSFANSIVPLAVLELYLRAQRAGAPARLSMALFLFVLTVAMGAGIFGATVEMWLPLIRTGQMNF